MKVILLADIAGLGRRFEIKEVADGYGRNFLLRNKKAELATPDALKSAEKKLAEMSAKETLKLEAAEKAVASLKGKTVKMKAKANEEGHLFAGLHLKDIAEAVKSQLGVSLDESAYDVPANLKSVGEHKISVKAGKMETELSVSVEAI